MMLSELYFDIALPCSYPESAPQRTWLSLRTNLGLACGFHIAVDYHAPCDRFSILKFIVCRVVAINDSGSVGTDDDLESEYRSAPHC